MALQEPLINIVASAIIVEFFAALMTAIGPDNSALDPARTTIWQRNSSEPPRRHTTSTSTPVSTLPTLVDPSSTTPSTRPSSRKLSKSSRCTSCAFGRPQAADPV